MYLYSTYKYLNLTCKKEFSLTFRHKKSLLGHQSKKIFNITGKRRALFVTSREAGGSRRMPASLSCMFIYYDLLIFMGKLKKNQLSFRINKFSFFIANVFFIIWIQMHVLRWFLLENLQRISEVQVCKNAFRGIHNNNLQHLHFLPLFMSRAK